MQKSNWEQQMDATLIDVTLINTALESNKKMIQLKAIFKVVQLGLYNEKTILILRKLSNCLKTEEDQIMGLYMLGHFSMAALYEISAKNNLDVNKGIYHTLDSRVQKQINNLIESKSLYQQ